MNFFRKEINLIFDQFSLEVESNPDMEIFILRLIEFKLDEEKSTSGNVYYTTENKIEIYPSEDEIKEIIKLLQQILPEDEENE
jgi:hypothetical protein